MDVVVNASPLILLCKAGYVELLSLVSNTVVVPQSVISEIEAQPDDPACMMVRNLPWLRPVTAQIPDSIKAWDLGAGESEVIAYALQNEGFRPLLDDAEGKACALAHGLRPMGTGGLLITAKHKGSISKVAPILMAIRSKGLWISDDVFAAILSRAGKETQNMGTISDHGPRTSDL